MMLGNLAEQNNCLTTPFSFTVAAPITVELECEKAGGVFDKNYCVIDYSQASSLKWTTNATSCKWVTPPSDKSGPVSGTSLSLTDLLSKLNFKYQLECTR